MIIRRRSALFSGLLTATGGALAGLPSTAAAVTETEYFYCNTTHDTFTVPEGLTQLEMELHGGQGEKRDGSLPGGYGGIVKATVPVTPGEVLNVFTGCAGNHNGNFGWGIGGQHGHADSALAEDGGYGGGGSAVIRASDLKELAVAGGGGGDGGDGGGGGEGGQGGAGGNGGINPQPGEQGFTPGHQNGGDGGCAACASGINGGGGTHSSALDDGGGGGGGGGGHVGGGGGHGGGGFVFGEGGGGGGGGSSYVIDTATNVSYGTDTTGGDGLVIFTFPSDPDAQAPAAAPEPAPTIATGCLGRGRLRALDLGQDPLRPCRSHEIEVTIPMTGSEAAQPSDAQ